jgi:hypothetical protein
VRSILASSAAVLVAAGLAVLPAAPASATVHEIVGQWCSGHDELAPPGISDPAKPNFARPLMANGFIGEPVPLVGPAGPGLLIDFNYDHPAAKVVGTGVFVVVGSTPAGPLYLELIEPDPSFPAFQHCPRLATG